MKSKYINLNLYLNEIKGPIGVDSIVDCLFVNMLASVMAMKKWVDRLCKEENISGPQYNILRTLQFHNGKANVNELREGMLSESSAMTRLIGKLSKAGFVKRSRGKRDRRIVNITITREGELCATKLTAKISSTLEPRLSHLEQNEIEQLICLLVKTRQFLT
jgi:DNA-binding MarR family transcriptional regulator